MAGVVPFPGGAHGRKQWNIRDENSSRRLRNQLADDGCPESQLILAKQLLQGEKGVSCSDNEENARFGVFWLIKASEQGNVEATDILHKCLETGEGITEHNYLDVKACLNTSQNEKLARRAAREMFMSLSCGQEFITSEQLRRRMSEIVLYDSPSCSKSKEGNQNAENDNLEAEKGMGNREENGSVKAEESETPEVHTEWSVRNENFGEKLTKDHLENAGVSYSRGELPLVQRVFALTDPQNRQMESLNYLHRTLLHPLLTVQQTYLKLLSHFSSNYRYNNILTFFPGLNYIQLLIVLLLYPVINMENVLLFLPMCVYYVSFFVMVMSTLQMLQSKKEYKNFRVWSRLFLSYDPYRILNTDDAEFEYCKKNLRPYGVYFLSLLLNLVAYPFVSELWIPESEFAIVAFALTFTTLYTFHDRTAKKLDFLMLFSFAVNVLAKYPYETDGVVRQTWRFLDIELPTLQSYGLPCFASQVVGNGVEFCLNFRGVFYLLMPAIFLKMASRENWRGTYKVLIPHCVTLSWWQVAVFSCQGATFYGLLRSTLALVGLVFFIPLAGVTALVLPVIALYKHFTEAALTTKAAITVILATVPVVVGYCTRKINLGTNFLKVQIFLVAVSVLFLVGPLLDDSSQSSPQVADQSLFSWDQYVSNCQRTSWDKRSFAEVQHECVVLRGANVNWEGRVDNVRIVKINNDLLKLFDHLPENLRSSLLCYYGEEYNCLNEETTDKAQLCKLVYQMNRKDKCHVNSWNKYELEISVQMSSEKWGVPETTIHLAADDSLKNFTLKLKPKDRIWFSGVLDHPETIGGEFLKVSVEEIGCINCADQELRSLKKKPSKVTSEIFAREIYNGIKRILNFICNPIVNFR